MSILQIKDVCKSYKKNNMIIDHLNLEIPSGKIVGLLGPNGCGKSTLIKMIAGILQPNSGEILVDNIPVGETTCGLISYLPERTYFDTSMKVIDILDYFEDFYSDFDRDRANRLFADLAIPLDAKLKALSKGTKEKVQLVLVMSRNAKLYLLDEPIAGVDPAARDYILSTIVSNYNPEASIIITTHLITDIEPILDDYIFMGYTGTILLSGNAEVTRNNTGRSLDDLFREVFRCYGSF